MFCVFDFFGYNIIKSFEINFFNFILFIINNFNVYLNELLSKLRENGLGCHMNGQFVDIFIYADDITILAPSHSSL